MTQLQAGGLGRAHPQALLAEAALRAQVLLHCGGLVGGWCEAHAQLRVAAEEDHVPVFQRRGQPCGGRAV